jgi:hypothetical protein
MILAISNAMIKLAFVVASAPPLKRSPTMARASEYSAKPKPPQVNITDSMGYQWGVSCDVANAPSVAAQPYKIMAFRHP